MSCWCLLPLSLELVTNLPEGSTIGFLHLVCYSSEHSLMMVLSFWELQDEFKNKIKEGDSNQTWVLYLEFFPRVQIVSGFKRLERHFPSVYLFESDKCILYMQNSSAILSKQIFEVFKISKIFWNKGWELAFKTLRLSSLYKEINLCPHHS